MLSTNIIPQLVAIGAVKTGNFTLKSGLTSPLYIDLRSLISYPSLLAQVADLMWQQISHLQPELLCGVPYTAIPLATCLALKHNFPMVMVRKEAKTYGTKKLVEGAYQAGQTCLVIEDVVTTGSSIITTLQTLTAAGLRVPYCISFLDREQGGSGALASYGCTLYRVFSLEELLTAL